MIFLIFCASISWFGVTLLTPRCRINPRFFSSASTANGSSMEPSSAPPRRLPHLLSSEARNKATFAIYTGRPRQPNSVFAGARRFQRIRPQSVYIKDQPSWPISVSNCIYATYALGNYLHRIR